MQSCLGVWEDNVRILLPVISCMFLLCWAKITSGRMNWGDKDGSNEYASQSGGLFAWKANWAPAERLLKSGTKNGSFADCCRRIEGKTNCIFESDSFYDGRRDSCLRDNQI